MWERIINEFSVNPRDVKTAPITNRTPKWFYVQVINNQVYVSNAVNHKESSSIKGKRQLNKTECNDILELFHKRMIGEYVSKKASELTVNQVYWYGIFNEMKVNE